jgi:hypothetical protein
MYEKEYWEKLRKVKEQNQSQHPCLNPGSPEHRLVFNSMISAHMLHQWQMNSSGCVSNSYAKCTIYHSKVLKFQYLHIFSSAQTKRNCTMNISPPLPHAHSARDVRTSDTDRHCAAVFHTACSHITQYISNQNRYRTFNYFSLQHSPE